MGRFNIVPLNKELMDEQGKCGGERSGERFLGLEKSICKGLLGVEAWYIQEIEKRQTKRQGRDETGEVGKGQIMQVMQAKIKNSIFILRTMETH